MTKSNLTIAAFIFVVVLTRVPASTHAQTPSSSQKEKALSSHASGSFDVKVTPEALADKSADATLGRMSIDKQYHGDLEGMGKGEMLTAGSSVKGSGAYVAIERVTGTLAGRTGSFVLQHRGVMTHGTPELSITVAPDSGTGQLEGISGTMNIQIDNGKHSYEFEYTIASSK
jgi:hypothetical protein